MGVILVTLDLAVMMFLELVRVKVADVVTIAPVAFAVAVAVVFFVVVVILAAIIIVSTDAFLDQIIVVFLVLRAIFSLLVFSSGKRIRASVFHSYSYL